MAPQVNYVIALSEKSAYLIHAKLISKCIDDSYIADCIKRNVDWIINHWCIGKRNLKPDLCEKIASNGLSIYCEYVEDHDTCKHRVNNFYGGVFQPKTPKVCPPPKSCPTTTSTTEATTTVAPFPTGILFGGILLGALIGSILIVLFCCLCKRKPSDNEIDPESGKGKKKNKKNKKGKTTTGSNGTTKSSGKVTTSAEDVENKKQKKKGKKGKKEKKGKKNTTKTNSTNIASAY